MNKRILLIGGGGHCKSVIDTIVSMDIYDEIGIVDEIEGSIMGIPVLGRDEHLKELFFKGFHEAFVTVGSVGDTSTRRKIYDNLKKLGFTIPVIIDSTAIIARNCSIEEGTFVGKNAVVNSETKIGICSIINTGSIVEHECLIGDFSHISPGAVVCGQVMIGNDTHIGANSVIRQQIKIGRNCLIGAGSVVVKDIPDEKKAFGNPCVVIE